jgi:hypothetical protein
LNRKVSISKRRLEVMQKRCDSRRNNRCCQQACLLQRGHPSLLRDGRWVNGKHQRQTHVLDA